MSDAENKAEPPTQFPWFRTAIICLSILITILIFDFGIRTMEASKLVSAIEKSEMVFETFNSETKDASVSLFVSLSQSTAKDTYSSGVRVEELLILPWHKKLNDARDYYLEYNKAWYELLSSARLENGEFTSSDTKDIAPTWIQVKYSLPGAIPSPDLFSLKDRTSLILSY
jgi:hypothetical protein